MAKKTTPPSKPATWKCDHCGDETQSETKPQRGTCRKNPLGHVWKVKAK